MPIRVPIRVPLQPVPAMPVTSKRAIAARRAVQAVTDSAIYWSKSR
jgi:hypothetical protein